jgi:hypothetical protein
MQLNPLLLGEFIDSLLNLVADSLYERPESLLLLDFICILSAARSILLSFLVFSAHYLPPELQVLEAANVL